MNEPAGKENGISKSEAPEASIEERPQQRKEADDAGNSNVLAELSYQFSARIEGLRELLDAISPHVAALDQPEGIERTIDQAGLSPRGKGVLKDVILKPFDMAASDGPEKMEEARTRGSSETDADKPVEDVPPEAEALADVALEEPDGVLKVLHRLTQGFIAPRSSLLHGSLLTVAVASFEFLIAGLFSHHLLTYPKQLKADEREFSLADLVELGSIDEARRLLVERRADSFMRRGLDDWSRWAQQTLGEPFANLCLDSSHLNEVFQRRHLVVHSGGAVSRLYLERVDLPEAEKPQLGEDLPVTAPYLQDALDELEILGHSLLALALSKWEPKSSDVASSLLNVKVFDLLKARRWALARKLAATGALLDQSSSGRWTITANQWLAAKRMGELDQCRDEIVAWDVSALENQFKLARACLLDEDDEAFQLLELTLQEPDQKPRHVLTWPLLDDLRADPRFADAFARVGIVLPEAEARDISATVEPEDSQDSQERDAP